MLSVGRRASLYDRGARLALHKEKALRKVARNGWLLDSTLTTALKDDFGERVVHLDSSNGQAGSTAAIEVRS